MAENNKFSSGEKNEFDLMEGEKNEMRLIKNHRSDGRHLIVSHCNNVVFFLLLIHQILCHHPNDQVFSRH